MSDKYKDLKGFFKNSGPLWDKDDMIEAYMEHALFLTGVPDFSNIEDHDVFMSVLKDFLMEYSNRFFDQTMEGVCNVITSFENEEKFMEENKL